MKQRQVLTGKASRFEYFVLSAGSGLLILAFSYSVQTSFTLTKATALWVLASFLSYFYLKSGLRSYASIKFVLIFLAILLLSFVGSEIPGKSFLGERQKYEGLVTYFSYMAVFLYFSSRFIEYKKVFRWLAILSLPVSLYGIFQFMGFDPWQWTADWSGNRSASTFGQPNVLGTFFNLIIPLCFVSFCIENRSRKVLFYIAGLLGFACLIATFTRGSWFGFLVSAVYLMLHLKRSHFSDNKVYAPLIGILTVILAIAIYPAVNKTSESVIDKVVAISSADQFSTRRFMWTETLGIIAERPLLGWGNDSFRTIYPRFRSKDSVTAQPEWDETSPHNILLEYSYSMGLLGLLMLLWVVLFGMMSIRNKFEANLMHSDDSLYLKAVNASLIGYIVALQFEITAIGVMPIFWALAGIAISKENIVIEATRRFSSLAKPKLAWVSLSVIPLLFLPFAAELYYARSIQEADSRYSQLATALNPFDEAYDIQSARLLLYSKPEQALVSMDGAILKNPQSWEIHYRIAELYLMDSRTDIHSQTMARSALAQAKRFNPLEPKIKLLDIKLSLSEQQ